MISNCGKIKYCSAAHLQVTSRPRCWRPSRQGKTTCCFCCPLCQHHGNLLQVWSNACHRGQKGPAGDAAPLRTLVSILRRHAACVLPAQPTRQRGAHADAGTAVMAGTSGTGMAPRSPSTSADTTVPAGSTPAACVGRGSRVASREGGSGQGQAGEGRPHTGGAHAPHARPLWGWPATGGGPHLRDLQQHVCRAQRQQPAADLATRAGRHELTAHRARRRALCTQGGGRRGHHEAGAPAAGGSGSPPASASRRCARAPPPPRPRSSPGRAQRATARWYSGRSGSILMGIAVRTCSRRRRGSCTEEQAERARETAARVAQAQVQVPALASPRAPPPHLPALHLAQAGHDGQVERHQGAHRVAGQTEHEQAPARMSSARHIAGARSGCEAWARQRRRAGAGRRWRGRTCSARGRAPWQR